MNNHSQSPSGRYSSRSNAQSSLRNISTLIDDLSSASLADSLEQSPLLTRQLKRTTLGAHQIQASTPCRFPVSDTPVPLKEGDDPESLANDTLINSTIGTISRHFNPTTFSIPRMNQGKTAKIEDHLYTRGFLEGACFDVVVKAFGTSYNLHRIILDRAPFFSSLFAGPWTDSDTPSVELQFDDPNITQTSFEAAIARLYGKMDFQEEERSCLSLLATAAYLDMQDLVERCLNSVLKSLSCNNVADRLKFANGSRYYGLPSERLSEACRALLCRDGWEMGAQNWDDISSETTASVIASDSFWVATEYDRYVFARNMLEWRMSIFDETDLKPLRDVLNGSIHYMHMSFEQLQSIGTDRNKYNNQLFVRPDVIHDALWNQMILRQTVLNTSPDSVSLGVSSTSSPTDDIRFYSIPTSDTTLIGDPFSEQYIKMGGERKDASLPWSQYPPFRFSVEFTGVKGLKEDKRVYSRTVFYAGSHWNIYIQKVKTRKNLQLGVYLHRAKDKTPEVFLTPERISQLERDLFSRRSDNPELQNSDEEPSSPVAAAEFARSEPIVVSALPSYVDHRPTIQTYFKIFCPSRRGRVGMTEFNSSPDQFNHSQSWGWKSSSLCLDDKQDEDVQDSIKFMVILGNV
ncbi:Germ cell-less protein-like 1 [Neolecta irregularis DAH-3]|uniref:Germ cell-less protein-like 1 n=1 Tax=Neolecta irregularis (strain DAH-3) TaxID=1198029 RepID=A0A1U7LW45_NEOID|nr:Germ cell-less protein-like 1 [Neolecta irregularis DAH-3]|eukprot:OLL26906.1 Germ cell-less protein-like 1 [Neolecta irregularis DAH-3]